MPTKGPRKYAGDVVVSFGLVSITGNIFPLASKDKVDSFRLGCPTCAESKVVSRMTQGYTCATDADHGPFPNGDCVRLTGDDENLSIVTEEEIAEVRTGDSDTEKKVAPKLHLSVHPSSQVNRRSWPTGNSYWFEPNTGSEQSYGLLNDLVGEDDLAFVGTIVLRKQEKLVRLVRAEFGIVIEEIFRPEQIYDFVAPDTDYKGELIGVALDLVEKLKADFDPATYKSKVADRMAELVASKQGAEGTTAPTSSSKPSSGPTDLAALLEASLQATKDAKAS